MDGVRLFAVSPETIAKMVKKSAAKVPIRSIPRDLSIQSILSVYYTHEAGCVKKLLGLGLFSPEAEQILSSVQEIDSSRKLFDFPFWNNYKVFWEIQIRSRILNHLSHHTSHQ